MHGGLLQLVSAYLKPVWSSKAFIIEYTCTLIFVNYTIGDF